MKIFRAEYMGMCFGVRDAIRLALDEAAQNPISILGDLVHNQTVLDYLSAKGVKIEKRPEEVKTAKAMVTAHGTSHKAIGQALAHGLKLLDATCPLVRLAHRSVESLIRAGYHPVIIGKANHVEVRGISDDLAQFDVILNDEDVRRLTARPKFGVVAQTTQPIDRVRHLVSLMHEQFPHAEIKFMDTVCMPTKQRQEAAVELAQTVDAVIVVGGSHSNNTQELAATCRKYCPQVFTVRKADELNPLWFAGLNSAGITAGTSTPDRDIDAVERRLREISLGLDTIDHSQPCHQIHAPTEEPALALTH